MRTSALALACLTAAAPAHADYLDDALRRERCGGWQDRTGPVIVPHCESWVADRATVIDPAKTDEPRDPVAPAKPPAIDPEHDLRWQAQLDVRLGSAKVDGADLDYQVGLGGAFGPRFGRLALLGEYAMSFVGYHAATFDGTAPPFGDAGARGGALPAADTDGVMHRLGASARYSIAKAATDGGELPQAIGELWLEAGVGEEIVHWDRGGVLARPDLALGIGMQGALRTSAHRRGGMFFAFRIHFAERTDLDGAPAACSAPCTESSRPALWGDRSYLFDVGFVWDN